MEASAQIAVNGADESGAFNYVPDADAGHRSDRYHVGEEYVGTRLRAAFVALAERGLFAKMRYMCCQSCAGHSLASEAEVLVRQMREGTATDTQRIVGCVYFTQQDADDLTFGKGMFLSFGQINSHADGRIGRPTVEVGRIVGEALATAGIVCKWDGSASSRIWVERASALSPATL
jgi:hypothetical protein